MKRNVVQNTASSGNYEEEPTSEAITKKQRKTRSDKNYKNEEEKREACKEINKEDWCGKFHLWTQETARNVATNKLSCSSTSGWSNCWKGWLWMGIFLKISLKKKMVSAVNFGFAVHWVPKSELDKTNGLGSGSLSESWTESPIIAENGATESVVLLRRIAVSELHQR